MKSYHLAVGVMSDILGLLRPEAVAALRGSDLIVHAGDVGSTEILDALRAVAPTFAVRGNVWRRYLRRLPRPLVGERAGRSRCLTAT